MPDGARYDESEIDAVVREGLESRRFEFKDAMSFGDVATRGKVIKAALAFANTEDGGCIIFGMRKRADSDIHDRVGLTDEQRKTFRTDNVADVVNQHAQPPIRLAVRERDLDGMTLVIISVSQFDDLPVMATKSFAVNGESQPVVSKGEIYCRQRGTVATIRVADPAHFHEIVRLATRHETIRYLTIERSLSKAGPTDAARFRAELGDWGT